MVEGLVHYVIFLLVSLVRAYDGCMQARDFLSQLGDLGQTQIFAKIENTEVKWINCQF